MFHSCYKPQIRMRLIFTAYAINSAFVCFIITIALMCFEEHSTGFQRIINWVTDFMFIVFGPVLFLFCMIGFSYMPGLVEDCQAILPDEALHGEIAHPADIAVLFICSVISFCVLFVYAASITIKLMNKDLADEMSVSYNIFARCLQRGKDDYQHEKDESKKRRLGMLKRQNDEEDGSDNDEEE